MRLQINPHAISCHRDECGSSFVTVWFITPRDDESAAEQRTDYNLTVELIILIEFNL